MDIEELTKRNDAEIDALERMIAITAGVIGEERCAVDPIVIKSRAELATHLRIRGWLNEELGVPSA